MSSSRRTTRASAASNPDQAATTGSAASARLSDPYVETTDDEMEEDAEYEPREDDWEDEEDEEDEVDEEDEFFDLEDQEDRMDILQDVLLDVANNIEAEEDREDDTEPTQTGTRTLYLSRDNLLQVLNSVGMGTRNRLLASLLRDEDEDTSGYWARSRRRRQSHPLEPIPCKQGQDLIEAGTFGFNERRMGRISRAKKHARRILDRELGSVSAGRERAKTHLLKQDLLPDEEADFIINNDQRYYSGQFSNDGNFYFNCNQDMKVRLYDTSNPYDWKFYKEVDMPYGNWTITDASLTNDNKQLVYSTMSHVIALTSTDPDVETHAHLLDLGRGIGGSSRFSHHRWFSVYSVRFSGDGREVVAGTGDNAVYVFDIEADKTILRIPNHDDDVNAVCFGDVNSPHILYSGSDDCTVKVWDRRSMGDGRAAGVFLGHTEGVTYVDSKGDGRYVISNAKDQTAKLWDLRKVIATDKADKINNYAYSQGYNYRENNYDVSQWTPHPNDCSLVTFRGHRVEQTLIRCHFGPQGSTDGRYVYSGSQDGKVYIWNMDARLERTIDVTASTEYMREMPESRSSHWGNGTYRTVVRDCSWHPSVPMIAATAWNGHGSSRGTCSVHSWNDGLNSDDAMQVKGRRYDVELRSLDEARNLRPRRRRGHE